jgi:cytochrome P450 family 6
MILVFDSAIFIVLVLFTAIVIGLYFYFTQNFKFRHKLGIPYVKPTSFVGSLKEYVWLKTTVGEQLQRIYNEHSDKPYVGIFSFEQPSLLIRDLELVKNVLAKNPQNFTVRVVLFNEKVDFLLSRILCMMEGER